jgi:serine protease Do
MALKFLVSAVAAVSLNIALPAVAAAPRGTPDSFADLAERLSPAVVNISSAQRVPGAKPGPDSSQLQKKFSSPAVSLGSGFIIDPKGIIVTNNHVIDNAEQVTVTMHDGREFKATIRAVDRETDLAVLQLDAPPAKLPFVSFGDSNVARVGDWVLAIGNPFGLGGTVTAGIVSALHRGIQGGGAYDRYIQTDASINQGNSGGPLFDLNGNVIGVNTAIFSPTGGNVGVGFAIPSELAKPVIDQLRASGKVKRGYLGVQIQNMTPAIASSLGLPKDRGEIVASVEPSGPARAAGIQQGDVVVKVAGQDVSPDTSLSFIVANTPVGSRVPIEVIRGGKRLTLMATISERPSEASLLGQAEQTEPEDSAGSDQPGAEAARKSLGLTLQALSPEIRQQLRLPETVQGVVVAKVNPSSNAAEEGLQRGDIIVSVNQNPVRTPQEAANAVAAARKTGRDTVLLFVQRGNLPGRFVGVKIQ